MYTKRTVWRYPFPYGPFGTLGFGADCFRHVKVEEFADADRTERVDKRFYYMYRSMTARRRLWIVGKPAWADSVPYRAAEFRTAIEAGARNVWITEGEKDADRLAAALRGRRRSVAVLSSSRGSSGFSESEAEWIRAAAARRGELAVTIVADRDPAGARAALATRDAIGFGRVVRTPVEKAGADLSDHLDAGLRARDLVPIEVEALREWVAKHALVAAPGRNGWAGSGAEEEASNSELGRLLADQGWKVKRA